MKSGNAPIIAPKRHGKRKRSDVVERRNKRGEPLIAEREGLAKLIPK